MRHHGRGRSGRRRHGSIGRSTTSCRRRRFRRAMFIDTTRGSIELALLVNDAPITCHNFITLARARLLQRRYGSIAWCRLRRPGRRSARRRNRRSWLRDSRRAQRCSPYLRGTVGMALDWADTGGSQFFITHSPQPHLDAKYTVFGHVVVGDGRRGHAAGGRCDRARTGVGWGDDARWRRSVSSQSVGQSPTRVAERLRRDGPKPPYVKTGPSGPVVHARRWLPPPRVRLEARTAYRFLAVFFAAFLAAFFAIGFSPPLHIRDCLDTRDSPRSLADCPWARRLGRCSRVAAGPLVTWPRTGE